MKITLNIADRILLTQILISIKDNYAMLKSVREFMEELSLTEDEKEQYVIKTINNQTSWKKNFERQYEIPTSVYERIKILLNDKNRRNELNMQLIDIYEKFCEQTCEQTQEIKTKKHKQGDGM